MYRKSNGHWLKTKIIATIGPEKRDVFDLEGNKKEMVAYDKLFRWFVQSGCPQCFMVDALRLNMAFYGSDEHNEMYKRIFEWMERERNGLSRNVAILGDLAGAKTRLGQVEGGQADLDRDQELNLSLVDNQTGTEKQVSVLAYEKPLNTLREFGEIETKLHNAFKSKSQGITVSIGDGKVVLTAVGETNGIVHCRVKKGGTIASQQGVTFEQIDLGLPSFGETDKRALGFLLDMNKGKGFVAHIAVSFVREADDILKVREFAERYFTEQGRSREENCLYCPDVIAKIETKQGVKNIAEILDVADGAMIARGDLALQLSREDVPKIQKDIIRSCNERGKTVITATEMLASMEDNPEPTRAEVNDVFNAIVDGTDAIMLSGETAKGKYPAQAVQYMARIAEKAELYFETIWPRGSPLNAQRLGELLRGSANLIDETNERLSKRIQKYLGQKGPFAQWAKDLYEEKLTKSLRQGTTDRICHAGCILAEEEVFKTIIASTALGRTVRMISRFRPSIKIIGAAYDDVIRRKLLLSNGVYPVNIGRSCSSSRRPLQNTEEVFERSVAVSKSEGLIEKGDSVIFISGTPLFESGTVNIVQIKEIPG